MPKALIVDDAATVRLFYRAVLEELNLEVHEAANGYEGLEKSSLQPFDLFIVDVNMPRMDGYTFVRNLRQMEGCQGIPVLMTSTESKDSDRTEAFRSGANLYLNKPIEADDFAAFVTLILGQTA